MTQGIKIDVDKFFNELTRQYALSDYKDWISFVKWEYDLSRPTLDRIKENGEIATKSVVDKLKVKLDIQEYLL